MYLGNIPVGLFFSWLSKIDMRLGKILIVSERSYV